VAERRWKLRLLADDCPKTSSSVASSFFSNFSWSGVITGMILLLGNTTTSELRLLALLATLS